MNTSKTSQPELLAPAGDWESLRAAVANGADAVYFGLAHFNARARATNFTVAELPEVMHFLHSHNVRGFVTVNILIFSDELFEVQTLIAKIAEAGVDAVIVQDLGLVRLIQTLAPTLPIHASTQMTLTEPRGIEFVRKLGVQRVVLARELSIEDIRKILHQTDMPVEVFCHGALCVAYSGQCLTSEALGGRSANRGQCAQACRLPYELIVDGQPRDLGDRAYLLSPQDLAAFDLIQPLIEAGVISFKIEGRLKGGPYVAATTQTYRKAIDAALAEQAFHLPRREELDLAQTFSRGLTHGFLDGVNHQTLVRGRFPKSRGILLGKVIGFGKNSARLELAEEIDEFVKPGDGVVFDLGKPQEQEPGGRVWTVHFQGYGPSSCPIVELRFEAESVDFSLIPVGCRVWKTDDPALRKRLEQSYAQDRGFRHVPIHATLQGTLGDRVTLRLSTPERQNVEVDWPGPLELARKHPTTAEIIREQIARLGGTPYELSKLRIELPDNVMIPKSVLNDLRRSAVEKLDALRTQSVKHSIAVPDALTRLRKDIATRRDSDAAPRLNVLVRNLEQLRAVLEWKPAEGLPQPELITCDFEDLRRYQEAVTLAHDAGFPVALATNRIWKPSEEGFQSLVVRAAPDVVLIRNLASISYYQESLPHAKLMGDFSLNVANELTAELLIQAGLQRLVPSYDLNWEQFQSLIRRANPLWFEPVIHQHMPMFHMEHCVFAAFMSQGKDFRDCGRPCEHHKVELRDRVGALFPIHPDTGCRNTVFNSVAQSAAEYVERMRKLGIRHFRVDLLRETGPQVAPLLNRYARVIAGLDDGHDTWRKLRVLNQLGVTRGTLQMV